MKNVICIFFFGMLSSGFACGLRCVGYSIVIDQGGIPPICADTLIHQIPGGCMESSIDEGCMYDGVYYPELIVVHYRLVPPTPGQQQLCMLVKEACLWLGGTEEQCNREYTDCMNSYAQCEETETEEYRPRPGCHV